MGRSSQLGPRHCFRAFIGANQPVVIAREVNRHTSNTLAKPTFARRNRCFTWLIMHSLSRTVRLTQRRLPPRDAIGRRLIKHHVDKCRRRSVGRDATAKKHLAQFRHCCRCHVDLPKNLLVLIEKPKDWVMRRRISDLNGRVMRSKLALDKIAEVVKLIEAAPAACLDNSSDHMTVGRLVLAPLERAG